jgi:hypothetical protein
VNQFGDGLNLEPYHSQNIKGDELYIKQGDSYEPIKDALIRDIPFLASLVGLPT